MLEELRRAPLSLYSTYIFIYIPWGFAMNSFGIWAEVAKFNHWWQVFTCYGLYMIPISILLKNKSIVTQYAYGLVAMAFLEFCGNYFQTSYTFPNNAIESFFGIRNFALGMAMFFALYFPVGNWAVEKLHGLLFKNNRVPQQEE